MLAAVAKERQYYWSLRVRHVIFPYNYSVSAATGSVLNEVHLGRLLRLPLEFFQRDGVARHQTVARGHLAAWCPTASNGQTTSSARTIPSPFLAWNTENLPFPTHCVRFPIS